MREATVRRSWLAGELAAMRVPDLRLLGPQGGVPTLANVAESWRDHASTLLPARPLRTE